MVRLTRELIERARAFINPMKERELDLRGYKIPVIENLGFAVDGYDSIDFSDNALVKLENFPVMPTLRTLLLNNNMISRLGEGLATQLPKLELLVLTNNKISALGELDALAKLHSLRELSLLFNPVTKRQYYRLYVIHKVPSLRVLDFCKIKDKEREAAKALFKSQAGKEVEAQAAASRTFTPGEPIEGVVPLGASYTPAQRALMEAAIMNATTPEEVDRLEYYYKQGIVPPELQGSMGGSGGASVTVIAGGGSGEGQTQPTVTVTGGDVD